MTPRHFVWQAWHNLTSTFISRGRRGTNSHPPSFCVAGVGQMGLGGALGPAWAPVTPRHFAWQAWHNLTSTFVSRGRRGTKSHLLSFYVAGVGQMAMGGALGPGLGARDAAALCVAGVAQPDIHLRFTWPAWHKLTSTVVLRGRRGTDGTGWRAWTGLGARDAVAFCVAGVAQPDIHLHFTWQAWHLVTSTFVSRGRQAWCLVTSCDIHLRFAWQACHLETCTFLLSHTIFYTPSLTHHLSHHFVTRHLSHTVTDHLFTPSFTHHLSHNTLSRTIFHHTIFHTPLCHTPSFTTPSFTHNFVAHHLSPHHLSHTSLSHPTFHTPSFTHHIVTHHLSHTTLSHTIFDTPLCHTPLCHTSHCHTPSFTHHIVTHHLSHTTLSHTIFDTPLCHTPLCHTPSFTHHLPHTTLSHAIFHTPSQTIFSHHLSHTTLSHTIFHHTILHTPLCHTPSFTTPSFTHNFVAHHLSPHHL